MKHRMFEQAMAEAAAPRLGRTDTPNSDPIGRPIALGGRGAP